MARGQLPFVVIDTSGNAVVGANVNVTNRVTATPATIWADETTTTNQLGNPVVTDAKGRVPGWLDEGAYSASISGAGITTYALNFEVLSGRGTSLVAPNAIGSSQLQNSAILAAALAASTIAALLPAGLILPFGGNAAPSGWVICNGATYDGTLAQYQALWNVINLTYGGTGQSAFKVPDLQGRMPVGAGTASGGSVYGATAKTLGVPGGHEAVRLNSAQSGVPAHSHPNNISVIGVGDHSHNYGWPLLRNQAGGGAVGYAGGAATLVTETGTQNAGAHSHGLNGGVQNNGAADATADHTNMPPYLPITYIIKL